MQIDLDQVVDEYAAAHAKQCRASGVAPGTVNATSAKATLADVIAKLRASGVNLGSILQLLGPILTLIFAGTPVASIIAAILALLNGVTPPAGTTGS